MQFHPSEGFKYAIRILGCFKKPCGGELRVLAVQTEGPEFKSLTLREHCLGAPVTPVLLEAERAGHPKSTSGLFVFLGVGTHVHTCITPYVCKKL